MRERNSSGVQYSPAPAPQNIPLEVRIYLNQELQRLAGVISLLAAGHIDMTHVEPARPRDGDIRLADGSDWNPSSGGQGFYGYYGGAWHKLG